MGDEHKITVQTENWDGRLINLLMSWQNDVATSVHKRLVGNDSDDAIKVRSLMRELMEWNLSSDEEQAVSTSPSVEAMNAMAGYAEQFAFMGSPIGVAWLSVMANAEVLMGGDMEAQQHGTKKYVKADESDGDS